jgi:hypothetical protein
MFQQLMFLALIASVLSANAQDRETKVRSDRRNVLDEGYWIYNDLKTGLETARIRNKPVLVLLRCIPCENCQGFDRELMKRGELVRDLLEKFVCVRIVKANGLDLNQFQYDFDLSSAAFFMNADGTIYGRYGTRTGHGDGESDVSLEGFAAALERTLAWHQEFPLLRAGLQAKKAAYAGPATPEKYPALAKYGSELDYEGKVVQSCIHCHQIRDAERALLRERKQPIPDNVLYPYPNPAHYGLVFDVKQCATLAAVKPGSPAEKAGLKGGDSITELNGQPLLSIADVQWVLHNLPVSDQGQSLQARVERDGKTREVTIALPPGWRKQDISWRPTTWDLRRMALGGLKLVELSPEERAKAGLSADSLALRVQHLGQYSPHDFAKRAGFQKDDILVKFAGLKGAQSETELIGEALRHLAGEKLPVSVLRGGRELALQLPLQ